MKKVKLKPEILDQMRKNNLYQFIPSVGFTVDYNGHTCFITRDFDIPYFEVIDDLMAIDYYEIIEPDKLGKWGLLKDLTEPYEPFEITIDDGIFDM